MSAPARCWARRAATCPISLPAPAGSVLRRCRRASSENLHDVKQARPQRRQIRRGRIMCEETLGAADIHDILRMLPHRYPFLLIDRVTDIRGEDHGIGIKNVTMNEPHFAGHFPDN